MHSLTQRFTPKLAAPAIALAAALASPLAMAESHALIMWIGSYSNPEANLPGIDKDAAIAREIARSMGVGDQNITEISNGQADLRGIRSAMNNLARRVNPGDQVFLYYSGHGGQINRTGGGCMEGLVSYDLQIYADSDLQADLNALAAKARQVVMFNDSCFSGGAASKSRSASDATIKSIDVASKTGGSGSGNCGQAVNAKMTRNFEVVGAKTGANMFYLAASSENEVSLATRQGSLGTLAWLQCAQDPSTDTDRSGLITGEELTACSKSLVSRMANQRNTFQTVTAKFNDKLPVIPVRTAGASSSNQSVNALQTLEDLRAASDSQFRVALTAPRSTLRIGADTLDFSVSTSKDGYLYVLHIGSDGKTFDFLYPNKFDTNNFVKAGETRRLPGAGWQIKPAGPEGTSYLMAVVTPQPVSIEKIGNMSSGFSIMDATVDNSKTLYAVASGSAPGAHSGFGASAVVPFREVR